MDESNLENIIGNIYLGIDMKKLFNIRNKTYELALRKCSECWAIRFCTICYTTLSDAMINDEKCESVRNECEIHFKKYLQLMNANGTKLKDIFSKIHMTH